MAERHYSTMKSSSAQSGTYIQQKVKGLAYALLPELPAMERDFKELQQRHESLAQKLDQVKEEHAELSRQLETTNADRQNIAERYNVLVTQADELKRKFDLLQNEYEMNLANQAESLKNNNSAAAVTTLDNKPLVINGYEKNGVRNLLHRLNKVENICKEWFDKTPFFVRSVVINEEYGLLKRQLDVVHEMREFVMNNRQSFLRFPNFMVIGTPRSASTWVKTMFDQNKRVTFSIGETRYFSKFFNHNAEYYLSLLKNRRGNFRKFGKKDFETSIQGEKSPDYLSLPEAQVFFIKKLMPDLKIILLVRDPVDAMWSNVQFTFAKSGEELSTADSKRVFRVFDKWKLLWAYSSGIPVWKRHFNDFLIVHYEDINEDSVGQALKIYDFVGAPQESVSDGAAVTKKINEAARKVSISSEYFDYLRELFKDEYENWEKMFGRPPKYSM